MWDRHEMANANVIISHSDQGNEFQTDSKMKSNDEMCLRLMMGLFACSFSIHISIDFGVWDLHRNIYSN